MNRHPNTNELHYLFFSKKEIVVSYLIELEIHDKVFFNRTKTSITK
jgi:hypothetical protein